jgi:hypothetical protein
VMSGFSDDSTTTRWYIHKHPLGPKIEKVELK